MSASGAATPSGVRISSGTPGSATPDILVAAVSLWSARLQRVTHHACVMDHNHSMHVTAYRQRSRAHSVGKGEALGALTAAAHPVRQRCSSAAAPLVATMSAACACAACAANRSSSALSRARSSAIRAIRLCRSCLSTSRVTGFKAALLCRSNVLYSTLTFFSRVRSSAISCIDVPPSPALVAILMTTKRRRLDRPAACAGACDCALQERLGLPQRTRELLWGATRALSGYLHNDGIFGRSRPLPIRAVSLANLSLRSRHWVRSQARWTRWHRPILGTVTGNRGSDARPACSLAA